MYCPICHFEGNFNLFKKKGEWYPDDDWKCPKCLSSNRHRLIWLIYSEIFKEFKKGKLLHCSPMKCLKERFQNDFEYISIDFLLQETNAFTKADLKMDLRKTSFKNESFDIIICSCIIDQIREKNELAIKELFRILKPNGILFLVPIISEKTRLMEKNWSDRWVKYSLDYFERFKKNNFFVRIIKYNDIENWKDYGLGGTVLALCRKKESKLLVVAHPDDEILWFNPQDFNKIIIAFLKRKDNLQVSEGRKRVLERHPLKEKIECLNLTESGYKRDIRNIEAHVENYEKLIAKLKEKILPYDCIYTHNPWGEYVHPEHIQVNNVIIELAKVPVFAFDGITPITSKKRKMEKINLDLYRKIKEIYLTEKAWTWFKDYEPKAIQPYFQLK